MERIINRRGDINSSVCCSNQYAFEFHAYYIVLDAGECTVYLALEDLTTDRDHSMQNILESCDGR